MTEATTLRKSHDTALFDLSGTCQQKGLVARWRNGYFRDIRNWFRIRTQFGQLPVAKCTHVRCCMDLICIASDHRVLGCFLCVNNIFIVRSSFRDIDILTLSIEMPRSKSPSPQMKRLVLSRRCVALRPKSSSKEASSPQLGCTSE